MKVSRKAYRDKQNQATGPLVVAILAFFMLCYNGYKILFKAKDPEWNDLIWVVMLLTGVVIWRTRERKLQQLVIDETLK